MTPMLGGGKVVLSVDEIIATLKHSSLPTIIIEGKDDAIVYRPLERKLARHGVSLLAAGGRDVALEVYRRKTEIPWGENLVFVVDKDSWCVAGLPSEYNCSSIVTTEGYSVENDVICDGNFIGLMNDEERNSFFRDLTKFIEWYALAFSRYLAGSGQTYTTDPDQIISSTGQLLVPLQLIEAEAYPSELRATLESSPMLLLRGKSLFRLLMRRLSYAGREAKHHHRSLMQIVASNPGDNLCRIFEKVECFLDQKFEMKADA